MRTLMQELRSQVSSVWPHESVHLRAQNEGSKVGVIPEGLKHRTVQLSLEIDLTLATVAPPKPDHVLANVACFNQPWHIYSSGSIGVRG